MKIHSNTYKIPGPILHASQLYLISALQTVITRILSVLKMKKKTRLRSYHTAHVCGLSRFSHVRLFATLDCSPPGSSVHGIL